MSGLQRLNFQINLVIKSRVPSSGSRDEMG